MAKEAMGEVVEEVEDNLVTLKGFLAPSIFAILADGYEVLEEQALPQGVFLEANSTLTGTRGRAPVVGVEESDRREMSFQFVFQFAIMRGS